MPLLSVIIPTHRRPQILLETLKRLSGQSIAAELEVIVVHDGTEDGDTWKLMDGMHSPFARLEYFAIPKSQQGVARNRGVERATAHHVLFIGDDIFLAPDACEQHLRAHEHHGACAVLGYTTWDPECGITSVMRWLEQSGWQFGYPQIARFAHTIVPARIQHSFSYTSNISLPTVVAKHIRFREDVSLYGWEDMEWGMRLKDMGLHLVYEPDAKALHHHHMEPADSLGRMEQIGKSAVATERINPQLRVVPRGIKRMAYRLLALLPTMSGRHRAAFLRGILHAEQT